MKSNFNPSILKIFISEEIHFDVTSLGELYFYLKSGGDPNNVIYTSVTEELDEFKEVLNKGIFKLAISSYNGLLNLITASKCSLLKPEVLVRINPEIDVDAIIPATNKKGKFGVPLYGHAQDSAFELIRQIYSSKYLTFSGIHFHLGSQINNPECYLETLDQLELFLITLRKDFPDLQIKILDIGGGTPVSYSNDVPSSDNFGRIISKKINEFADSIGNDFTLIVESGRFLTAESCILISKIVNSKSLVDKKFLIVDSGYHLLLDSALINHEYPIHLISDSKTLNSKNLNFRWMDKYQKVHVVGRLCDSLDEFNVSEAKKFSAAYVKDLIVFHKVGAYSIVFNMPFHCQTKPVILLRNSKQDIQVIRNTQSIDDLFKQEGGYLSNAYG
jgi:diaminopimelate decarboxylase